MDDLTRRPRSVLRVWYSVSRYITLPGCWGALIVGCLSFTPSLLPRGGIVQGMFWLPFVTFWQVTADLPFATGVPAGHGHTYTSEYVDGWNAVMRPAGMTSEELAGLRKIVAGDE